MSYGGVLEIDQLYGYPKGPLCDLCFPQDIMDPLIDLCHVHPLHRPHGGKVNGITDPRPIDELFHECFKDGDVITSKFHLYGNVFQKVIMHV